jgi:hypothetical protein
VHNADSTATPDDGNWAYYWRQSQRPLVSLVFVAPLLLCYEAGVLLLGPQAMRNGADVWLRAILESIGFGQYLLLPLVTCAMLLGWHHVARDPWRLRSATLCSMVLECSLLAVVLLAVAHLQGHWFWSSSLRAANAMTDGASPHQFLGRLIAYCGAGIYEELLFRLLALPALTIGLRWMGVHRGAALATAIIATSLVFALAHYNLITEFGEPFHWFSFTFRVLAGSFFALLFVFRGFGIAVGAHACYDILIALY